MSETCLIIGAGQAGLTAAQSLREFGFKGAIILAGSEEHAPYQRPPLSKKVLSGEMAPERLALKPLAFFEAQNIDWRGQTTISEIDIASGRAHHQEGSFPFDHVILATGTAARTLPIAPSVTDRLFTLRGIDDAKRLSPHINSGSRVLIVGAGYIGLEVAAVANTLGAKVTLIEASERVLARSVGPEISAYFEALHRARGITIALQCKLTTVEESNEGLVAIASDGKRFQADVILVGIGSRPLTELAEAAGIATEDGVVVDAQCCTSSPHILAAGDCTRFFSTRYQRSLRLESVQNAIDQARAAANTIVGRTHTYDPLPWFWSDQFDIKLQIAGLSQGYDQVVVRGDKVANQFSAFYFTGRKLLAVDSINRPRDHMLARRHIGQEIVCPPEDVGRSDIEAWEALFKAG